MNTYDKIAPFYDLMAKLVFGNILLKTQRQYISAIKPGSRVLFIGGGTGKIIKDLFHHVPDIRVDYIEPAKGMIGRAKKNTPGKYAERINFIQGDHTAIPADIKYDAVLTFFVLDMFGQKAAEDFTQTLANSMKNEAQWLFADFFPVRNIFRRTLLHFMYFFFRVTTGITASEPPAYDKIIQQCGFFNREEKKYRGGFIRACIYSR